jgi:hypothetical protein
MFLCEVDFMLLPLQASYPQPRYLNSLELKTPCFRYSHWALHSTVNGDIIISNMWNMFAISIPDQAIEIFPFA